MCLEAALVWRPTSWQAKAASDSRLYARVIFGRFCIIIYWQISVPYYIFFLYFSSVQLLQRPISNIDNSDEEEEDEVQFNSFGRRLINERKHQQVCHNGFWSHCFNFSDSIILKCLNFLQENEIINILNKQYIIFLQNEQDKWLWLTRFLVEETSKCLIMTTKTVS